MIENDAFISMIMPQCQPLSVNQHLSATMKALCENDSVYHCDFYLRLTLE